MTCGPASVRIWEASSAKVVSWTWCSASIAQCPQQVGEPGAAGLHEREAGDAMDGHGRELPGVGVLVAGLAGDLQDLGGVGEAEVVNPLPARFPYIPMRLSRAEGAR
jgi:hypothetical protein